MRKLEITGFSEEPLYRKLLAVNIPLSLVCLCTTLYSILKSNGFMRKQ